MADTAWLEESVRLYEKMKDLALKQQSSIMENRLDAFLELARERDLLRSQIDGHEKKPGAPSKDLKSRDDPARKMAQQKTEIIRSILETDGKTEELLLQSRRELLSEIRDLRKGRKAVRGYHTRAPRPARFFDSQG